MKKIIFAALSLMLLKTANAQDYSIALIPKELLTHASTVIRDFVQAVDIKSDDDVVYHIKEAITVLNRNGVENAHLGLWHNKSMQVRSVKGMIYDEFNKQIGKISESDFIDQAYINSFSLFEDTRVKHFDPGVSTYPYTVVYEYELRAKQSLNIRPWYPAYAPGVAVEKSTLIVTANPAVNLRYSQNNYPGQVETATDSKGNKTYTWHVNNMKAGRDEPYSPIRTNDVTSVRVVPQHFSYEGIAGSFTNWEELGKWNYDKLLTGRQKLPLTTVEQMKQLTANVTDPKEKAKLVYEYMQHKTRYVSIQIGIGGYQPFTAAEVDQVSYGDCKALVNYTQALLKAVDIDSWYCVVNAGSGKISMKKDFASMDQGNHIILCLPFKNDTTWLECTNQKIPFGFLGDFTDDRWVLACTPDGGKLMHTPKYTADDNRESRNADLTLADDGKISGVIQTDFKGTQYNNRRAFADQSFRDQAKAIQRTYATINNMEVDSYKLDDDRKPIPTLKETLQLQAPEYAVKDDGKLKFYVNPANRAANIRELINRTEPVYINRGYTDEDKITYTLPDGYHPDKNLLHVSIHKDFGSYTANVTIEGNKLIYTRKLQVKDGTYSKDEYNDLVDFYQTAEEADHYKMVLVK